VHLFKPKEGVQMPVLGTALSLAKKASLYGLEEAVPITILKLHFDKIAAEMKSGKQEWQIKESVSQLCSGLLDLLDNKEEFIKQLLNEEEINLLKDTLQKLNEALPTERYGVIGAAEKNDFLESYEAINKILTKFTTTELEQQIDVDIPVYFEKDKFLKNYLEDAMKLQGESYSRISEYCATMRVRINRFFNDERYKFLFDRFPNHPHALATFLRHILGMLSNSKYNSQNDDHLTGIEEFPPYFSEEVIKAIEGKNENDFFTNHQVVIIDLNLLAREILENVTALIGRLILEFLQRIAKENKELRGKFPVVLVLEEAHNYIPEKTKGDKESVSKIIFERIAREGRKFGLSLVISSQRPSELSRTVLSQCNSFIIHRIQNPEDQQYIRSIVPSINQDLLNQLPALAQQTALIFGDCVRSPALVKIREAKPLPQSDDPEFFRHWIGEAGPEEPPFEDVCKRWEGGES